MKLESLMEPIWNFLTVPENIQPSDVIFLFGGIGEKRAKRAAELWLGNYAPRILITGGNQHPGKPIEAEYYFSVIIEEGIPESAIILETKAANTGENVKLGMQRLNERGITPQTVIIVTRSWQVRRCLATFHKLFPQVITYNSHYPETLDEYLKSVPGQELHRAGLLIKEAKKIRDYPGRGFIAENNIPKEVQEAIVRFEELS